MNLPLARYRFTFTVTRDTRLPEYAGSMLRGAFGHALRSVACMTRQKECTGCALLSTCPYLAIFAPVPPAEHALQKFSQIPVPYVIEPEHTAVREYPIGSTLRFDMVLMGRAIKELPLIILAWRRALARGLGARQGTAELAQVDLIHGQTAQTIFTPDHGQVMAHRAETAWIKETSSETSNTQKITLQFITPLRLQENGKALPPNRLTPKALLMSLVRRVHLLADFHFGQPLTADFAELAKHAAGITDNRQLRWQDWTRYSARQGQTMTLGGVVGRWSLTGELTPFLPYVQLGEMIHAGKEAAFGLGQYRLVEHNFSKPAHHRERAVQLTDSMEEIT